MKTKILLSITSLLPLMASTPLFNACSKVENNKSVSFEIIGQDNIKIGECWKYSTKFVDKMSASSVIWKSSDNSILKIDSEGNANALKAGEVILTATLLNNPNNFASKTICVVDAPLPKTIIINGNPLTYGGLWEQKYEAQVLPREASQQIVWSVNSDDANISQDGKLSITSPSMSHLKITATSQVNTNIRSTFDIEVDPMIQPTQIDICGSSIIDTKHQWSYSTCILPTNAVSQCIWSKNNENPQNCVNVDRSTGTVSASKAGSFDLIAKSVTGAILASKHIVINNSSPYLSNTHIKGNEYITPNKTFTFTIENGDNFNPEWSISDNGEIVSYDNSSVSIKSKYGNLLPIYLKAKSTANSEASLSYKINVAEAPTAINIQGTTTYRPNVEHHFTTLSEPSSASNKVIWTSSNESVLQIDKNTGNAHSINVGTTTLTATSVVDPSIKKDLVINVINAPSQIEVVGDVDIVADNQKEYEYSIQIHSDPKNESTDVTWTTDTPGLIKLKTSPSICKVVGQDVGDAVLKATLVENPSIWDDLNIKVWDKPEEMTIAGPRALLPNSQYDFTSIVDPVGAYNFVHWTTSDSDLATIDDNGHLTTLGQNGKFIVHAVSKYSSDISASLEVEINNNFVAINLGSTIGTSYSLENIPGAFEGQDFIAQFKSNVYTVEGQDRPIHNDLKDSDLEVIYNGENVIANCNLSHNVLTIPARFIDRTNPITINILGGEIADWIDWSTIGSMCDEDYQDKKRDSIKKYLAIGDYKRAYTEDGYFGHARLIGFNQNNQEIVDESGVHIQVPVPTAWEFYDKSYVDHIWGYEPRTGSQFEFIVGHPWQTEWCEIRPKCDEANFVDISPKQTVVQSNGDKDQEILNQYFVGSLGEYMDEDIEPLPEHTAEPHKGQDGDIYDYYNVSVYQSIKTLANRLIKFNCTGKNGKYFTRSLWTGGSWSNNQMMYVITASNGEMNYPTHGTEDSNIRNDKFSVYLMFSL